MESAGGIIAAVHMETGDSLPSQAEYYFASV